MEGVEGKIFFVLLSDGTLPRPEMMSSTQEEINIFIFAA